MGAVFKDCRVSGMTEEGTVFRIPEEIGNERVTEIGERAFYSCRSLRSIVFPSSIERVAPYAFAECRNLESLQFPDGLKEIGNYAFYNCQNLRSLFLGRNLASIGYGAFKNCLELSEITLELLPGRKNCLNTILQDEFQKVDLKIQYLDEEGKKQEQARLIFTDYEYEYVPQIEARQFNWETYGSGESYRISIADHEIDYEKYDSVFSVAIQEDDAETLDQIVACRLGWPYKLSDSSRKKYEDYVRKNMDHFLEVTISKQGQSDLFDRLLSYILEHSLLSPEKKKCAIDLSIAYRKPQVTAMLMGKQERETFSQKSNSIHSRFAL